MALLNQQLTYRINMALRRRKPSYRLNMALLRLQQRYRRLGRFEKRSTKQRPRMLEEAKELGWRFSCAVERELDERGEYWDEEEEDVKSWEEFFHDECSDKTSCLIRGEDNLYKCELLLDLYSYVKEELPWVIPDLQSIFQSVHGVWSIFLSDRNTSHLLEVLKLQDEKKVVELLDVPVKESEVRIFVQCLPYISQLRFSKRRPGMLEQPKFLRKLICAAAEREEETGEKILELLSSVCNYKTFLRMHRDDSYYKSELLLDLYSQLKDYETQTGRSVLPALQPLYQSVPAAWSIYLSDKKTFILLEVLKLQQEKKPLKLLDVTDEETEVRIFVRCLPYISKLSFSNQRPGMLEQPKFLQKLICEAAEREEETGEKLLELLSSVFNYKTFLRMDRDDNCIKSELLLDLYSQLKDYETRTGRGVLPAVQPLYQSVPVWSIWLADRKTSIFLEVLKLQQEKKSVELMDTTDEESEVRIFVQCLPYISKLRFHIHRPGMLKQPKFLQKLICEAAEREEETGEKILELLSSVFNYKTFLRMDRDDNCIKSELLLDLYSQLKDYETRTGRGVLTAVQPLYQSVPVWSIWLADRKTSIFLEVLKLQQEKKSVELMDVTDEESEVRIFVQCLPYISKLRFHIHRPGMLKQPKFLQKLICEAAEREEETGEKILGLFSSVFNYKTFLCMHKDDNFIKSELLLDLYSYLKDYETQTGRSVLPALQTLYQSVPAAWSIYLSDRKTSILLEVLKLQQEKKPVELLDVTDEEGEVRIFLQCLPYISKLSFSNQLPGMLEQPKFLRKLICEAAEQEEETGEKILELFSSVFNYETFLLMDSDDNDPKCELLLDLYSDMKDYETQTGRNVLPALQPLYQSVPAVWSINLSDRKTSILLEVLKLHEEKKPVELLDFTDEESEVRIFLQCLPYISKLSFSDQRPEMLEEGKFLRMLLCEAAEREEETGEKILQLFSSVFNYKTFHPMGTLGSDHNNTKSRGLLFLYEYMKDYETQTGRSVLPALQPLYQAVPAVWSIYLSEGMTSLLLEVLKLQQEKKPVELLDFSNEPESEVRTFFQCLPYISQLRASKSVILQLLTLVSGGSETDRVMRAGSLGRALGGELDLSKTRLHLKACKRLALVLKHCEGLTELDLSHCQLTDQQLGILIPHLHKAQVLDLSHNKLTDAVTDRLLQLLSTNTCIKTARLLNNCFVDTAPFMKDKRFEINNDVDNGKKRRKEQKQKKNKRMKR